MKNKNYENTISVTKRKDFGVYYTINEKLINDILNRADLLSGKILEPSCGTGEILLAIIKKIIFLLKEKGVAPRKIIDYISNNIYANDIDPEATKIAQGKVKELLSSFALEENITDCAIDKLKLNFTNYDFSIKKLFNQKFSLIVGNPLYVTMYGKRSRNMTEEKRAYYNTFDFVQDKKKNNKFNLSMFFIENALKLLNEKGQLIFILDIAFFR